MCSNKLIILRHFSASTKVPYFTTPIYYVNANPHIGHVYTSLITDAAQRWHQILTRDLLTKLSTGTDEHGTKIQQAAEKHGDSLNNYCTHISNKYKSMSDRFSIGYTDFIRTSDDVHKNTVHKFWKKLYKNGHIYTSTYKGWYCVSDETFLTETQLKETVDADGTKMLVSADSGHAVEWTEEQNYIFKLSSFTDELKYWLKNNENAVKPKKFHKILLEQIENLDAFHDVSVSRPSTRVHWGIKVPDDDSQTIYVWLDALVNYLTVAGYDLDGDSEFNNVWPADIQVIGKDILKFHGIYWPAFLIAAGLEPPRSIFCHSHWTVDSVKMSKSKGNVICPFDRSEIYTNDGLRYFLLREGVAHSDGNYSETKILRILNSELADTLGNLLSRCCGVALNPNQMFPKIHQHTFDTIFTLDVTKKLIDNLIALPDICEGHYKDLNFYKVADNVVSALHTANLFFETLKPWELKKNPNTKDQLEVVLHLTLECLRITGILLQPLIPNISKALLDKISVPVEERFFNNSKKVSWINLNDFEERKLLNEKIVLFKRIIVPGDSVKIKINRN